MRITIKPVLRTDKKIKQNGKLPIHLMVNFQNDRFRIATGKEIEPHLWDSKTGLVRNGSADTQTINFWIGREISKFNEFITQQELLCNLTFGMSDVRAYWKKEEKISIPDFYSFFEEQLELWKGINKQSTLDNYIYTLKILKRFKSRLEFNEINHSFLERFEHYLRTKRGNTTGGVFTKQKCLKAIVNSAIKNGLIKENPYAHFRIKNPPNRLTFLTMDECEAIEKLSLEDRFVGQQKARDFFLFSCYTGLRFTDVKNLTLDNIQGNLIVCKMEKTKKQVVVPLTIKAQAIINKYIVGTKPNESIFPMSNNKRTNINLKEIAIKANISKPLTFHIARHTFASAHVVLGTHVIVLKELMGHSSVEQTEIYAKADLRQLEESMSKFDKIACRA